MSHFELCRIIQSLNNSFHLRDLGTIFHKNCHKKFYIKTGSICVRQKKFSYIYIYYIYIYNVYVYRYADIYIYIIYIYIDRYIDIDIL